MELVPAVLSKIKQYKKIHLILDSIVETYCTIFSAAYLCFLVGVFEKIFSGKVYGAPVHFGQIGTKYNYNFKCQIRVFWSDPDEY